jgi:hypothetical protein
VSFWEEKNKNVSGELHLYRDVPPPLKYPVKANKVVIKEVVENKKEKEPLHCIQESLSP